MLDRRWLVITLEETTTGYGLRLHNASVTQIRLDWQVGLTISDEDGTTVKVVIAGPFTVLSPGDAYPPVTDPEQSGSNLCAAIFAMRFAPVAACDVVDGTMQLALGSGLTVRVPPSETAEAWEIDHPDFKLVSIPGGEVAVWS